MSALAPVMEGFFTERLLGQRRASPHTVASYRDAFGLLLGFAQRRVGKAPSKLEDLDAVVIGAALDGVELQVEVAPVPETDFTTYLRELEAFDPELLVATGHPSGSGSITVQSADLGFEDVQVLGADSTLAEVVSGAADSAIGRYADFDCVDFESEEYQELARRYLEMSDNTFMDDDAVAGYGIVQMIAQAVREVGDDPVESRSSSTARPSTCRATRSRWVGPSGASWPPRSRSSRSSARARHPRASTRPGSGTRRG
ncbi:MAG: ABC transporter substrate-binding protein [Acidimicrobiales bacterium]